MKKEIRFTVENVKSDDATMTHIITDRETGVQYLQAVYPNFGAGLTVLVDAEGKPLLHKG